MRRSKIILFTIALILFVSTFSSAQNLPNYLYEQKHDYFNDSNEVEFLLQANDEYWKVGQSKFVDYAQDFIVENKGYDLFEEELVSYDDFILQYENLSKPIYGEYQSLDDAECVSTFFQEYLDSTEITDSFTRNTSNDAVPSVEANILVFDITQTSATFTVSNLVSGSWDNRLEIQNIDSGIWYDISESFNIENGTYSCLDLTPATAYRGRITWYDEGSWYIKDVNFYTPPRAASLNITSVTGVSVTVDAQFPNNNDPNNRLEIYHPASDWWLELTTNSHNGLYTFYKLSPNRDYMVRLLYWSGSSWVVIDKFTKTNNEVIIMTRNSGTYIDTFFENPDIARVNGNSLTTWVARLNSIYAHMYNFIGQKPYNGAKITVDTSRTMSQNSWAESGNPTSINQLYMMRFIEERLNIGDWSFGVIHELGHNFSSPIFSNNFESELWANFIGYYAIEMAYATVYPNYNAYTGNGLKSYYFNDASNSYNKCIAGNYYHHDALTYTLIDIKDKIGWEPFKKAIAYITEIPQQYLPPRKGMLNLILTKLRVYSGVDVIQYIPNNARTIYEKSFDPIGYVTIEKSGRIFYDSTCTLSTNTMIANYTDAVKAFDTEFDIKFNLTSTSISNLLNGSDCPNSSNSGICTIACGPLAQCNTTHHKGNILLNVCIHSTYNTVRLVGHRLCSSTTGTHHDVNGFAKRNGRDSAVTTESINTNVTRTIQHELSHNLGVADGECSNQPCIIKGDVNKWCDNCKTIIFQNR